MVNVGLAKSNDYFVPLEDLMQYEEFSLFVQDGHQDRFRIIDFIQHAYNKDSPLSIKHEDLPSRVMAAYKMADLDSNAKYMNHLISIGESSLIIVDGQASGDAKFLLMVNEMISCYLSRVQNCNRWDMYVTYQSLFWEYTKRLRTPVSIMLDEDKALKAMDIKTKITEPAFALIKQIERLRIDIFGESKKQSEVAEQKVRRKISPESMAKSATRPG